MCQPRFHAPVIPPGGKMCATNACGVGGLVGGDGPSSGWGTVDEQWAGSCSVVCCDERCSFASSHSRQS
jgi:hypothetical protein